jgi:site-specific DNA recombinase
METVRVLGYARVSSEEQARDGVSLDAQVARIRAWAQATGAELVDIVIDSAVSGTRLLADRPAGARIAALLDARKPEADAVVVLRLDRLGRDAAESLTLLKRLRKGRVGLVSLADRIDLSTPNGRAMAAMSAVFAELERELIAQRTAEGLGALRERGKPWNHPPFGWTVADGVLIADPEQQATLARIRALRAAHLGYHKIAATLNDEDRATKRGGRWQAASVRQVLLTSANVPKSDPEPPAKRSAA